MKKLFFILISFLYTCVFYGQEIDTGYTINAGPTNINSEYRTIIVGKYGILIPKQDKISKKDKAFNFCDSFKLTLMMSGLPISLSSFDSLELNSIYHNEFNKDSTRVEYFNKSSGCIQSIFANFVLKLPIIVNGKLIDKSEEYSVLSKIGSNYKIQRIKRFLKKDIIDIQD
jgi:hypothetical protein